jgi:hypothetical protein
MNSKDLGIGILSVTATILLVGLFVVNVTQPERAYAFGQSGASGDFLVTTGQFDAVTELLYVLDTSVEQMNVYGFSVPMGRIELLRSLDVRWRQGAERRPTPGRGGEPRREK